MIAERLRALAEDNPGRLAIVDGEERITYGQLLRRIDSSREWLRQRLHIAPGDVILGSLENSWQFVACFFAIAESGGVFMPLHPGWRAPELRGFCERLKVHGVITGRASRPEWDQVVSSTRVLVIDDGFGEAPRSSRAHAADGNSPALYLATSGSTGTPRIVPRSHRNLLAGARNVARALTIVPDRRFLCVVPFYHSSGFHNSLILPLLNGARLILMQHFTPAACARLVAAERADVLIGSPFIYRMLLDHAQYLPTLDLCVSAGARMTQTLALAWQERFGTRVRQLYGSTETSVISIDRSAKPPPTGTVGTPIDEVEIRMLNESEVAVRSPMVMSGYIADPERNLRVFEDGFFRTGDLGRLDSDGRLRLFGRTRRVINMAGVKVDPVEIEQAVESLEGVVACEVDSGNGDRESELIRARIELREGVEMTRADVIAHCRRRLADYKLPRVIEFVEALPVTLAGKISSPWSAGGPGR
ncbi:MAG: class I adenylate-forming enzyme family protein [Bryobacteraceae bacterium]|jgi:long-chain acyl-CoA synthetase